MTTGEMINEEGEKFYCLDLDRQEAQWLYDVMGEIGGGVHFDKHGNSKGNVPIRKFCDAVWTYLYSVLDDPVAGRPFEVSPVMKNFHD